MKPEKTQPNAISPLGSTEIKTVARCSTCNYRNDMSHHSAIKVRGQFSTCYKNAMMRNTIEIDQWRTTRPVGCISIAKIDAGNSGLNLRRGGHYAVAVIPTMY